jgi:hypothetical protein
MIAYCHWRDALWRAVATNFLAGTLALGRQVVRLDVVVWLRTIGDQALKLAALAR